MRSPRHEACQRALAPTDVQSSAVARSRAQSSAVADGRARSRTVARVPITASSRRSNPYECQYRFTAGSPREIIGKNYLRP